MHGTNCIGVRKLFGTLSDMYELLYRAAVVAVGIIPVLLIVALLLR
jgi:hypothetical protein